MNAYRENWGLAFTAGVCGAAIMVPLLYLTQPIERTKMDICLLLGSLLTGHATGGGTWALGFVMHLILGGLIGCVYGMAFEWWGDSDWWRGAILSIPHSLLAGLAVWGIGHIHPLIPGTFPEPGYLGLAIGGRLAFHLFMLNAVYGATVGGIYRVRIEHADYHGFHRPVSHG